MDNQTDSKMDKSEIITKYTEFLLEEGKPPLNVYKFCKGIGIEESEFYKHFGTFEAIEKEVFVHFFDETHRVLENSENFNTYPAKEKLLSFYYTYMENLSANRSLIMYLLGNKNPMVGLNRLSGLKSKFTDFVEGLDLKTTDLPIQGISDLQQKGMKEAIYGQFLTIIKYWMKDNSAGFEQTDIFIEKSTSLGFELMNHSQLESIIDFGKFLLKDKIKLS
jgi:hypothetical protein